jgi:hypothetical protein
VQQKCLVDIDPGTIAARTLETTHGGETQGTADYQCIFSNG